MKIVAYHKKQLFIQECIFTFPKKEIDIQNLNNIYLNNSRLYSLYVSFFSCSVYSSFLLQADQSRFSQVYTSLISLSQYLYISSVYLFICLSQYLYILSGYLYIWVSLYLICLSSLSHYLYISSIYLFISVSLYLFCLSVYPLFSLVSLHLFFLFVCFINSLKTSLSLFYAIALFSIILCPRTRKIQILYLP